MKLKEVKIKKYKLMRLYLMKYEVYKICPNSHESIDVILDRIELGLKRILFIIYQYHIYNKTILFIGFPQSRDSKLSRVLLNSRHVFIPSFVWERGLLGNKSSISRRLRNSSYFRKFLEIKNNPHLVVLFNAGKLRNIIPECEKLSIPVVHLGKPLVDLEKSICYSVEGNFIKRKMKNFFQFLIYSILKRNINGRLKI